MQLSLFKNIRCRFMSVHSQISKCKKERDIIQLIVWILNVYFWTATLITLLLLVFDRDVPLIPMELAELAIWAFDSGNLMKIFGISVLSIQKVLLGLFYLSQVCHPRSGRLVLHIYGIVYLLLDSTAIIAMYILTTPMHYAAHPWIQAFSNLLFLVFNILKIILDTRKRKA